ncbi:MAG: NYN domain-containing protein [Pseudomonadota bacterium]
MTRDDRPLLAVLIDADNVPAKHATEILNEISGIGDPALRRVYGDWSSPGLTSWKDQIRELGMVARQQTANTKGKNASDIGLVIDAMDILHSDRFDGFVLVSSDSDFTQLASRLREDGRMVIGIGEKKTPAALRNVCNQFIFIENIVGDAEDTAARPKTKREPASKVVPIVRSAMAKIDQDHEWYRLGGVGSQIRAAHPDFDPRTYGSSKLSDLVKNLPGFETRQTGTHIELRWVGKKTKK